MRIHSYGADPKYKDGNQIFDSDMFKVIVWDTIDGIKTTIENHLLHTITELNLERSFLSNDQCVSIFTPTQVIEMIDAQSKLSFKKGKEHKLNELQKWLGIHWRSWKTIIRRIKCQITAKTYYDADQEANCFVAENGIDREYDYNGYYIERVLWKVNKKTKLGVNF